MSYIDEYEWIFEEFAEFFEYPELDFEEEESSDPADFIIMSASLYGVGVYYYGPVFSL